MATARDRKKHHGLCLLEPVDAHWLDSGFSAACAEHMDRELRFPSHHTARLGELHDWVVAEMKPEASNFRPLKRLKWGRYDRLQRTPGVRTVALVVTVLSLKLIISNTTEVK